MLVSAILLFSHETSISDGFSAINTDPAHVVRADIDPNKPMLALTFDDGPGIFTSSIVDTLEQHGGRATFCVVGSLVEIMPDVVKQTAEMGNEVIGHSWDHHDFTRLTANQIKAQLEDTNQIIQSVTGVAPQIHRLPYGKSNNNVRRVSGSLGLSIVQWTVDTHDWKTWNEDDIFSAVINGAMDRGIILLHDLNGATMLAMEKAVPELISAGFQLVTVSELFHHSGVIPAPGRIYYQGK
jgi:peptidoglycan/xylan/chitin deacetylase (PgdA/CDA1 family)